jgi:hypothetical protein
VRHAAGAQRRQETPDVGVERDDPHGEPVLRQSRDQGRPLALGAADVEPRADEQHPSHETTSA